MILGIIESTEGKKNMGTVGHLLVESNIKSKK